MKRRNRNWQTSEEVSKAPAQLTEPKAKTAHVLAAMQRHTNAEETFFFVVVVAGFLKKTAENLCLEIRKKKKKHVKGRA